MHDPKRHAREQFVEDELMRVPMLADQVLDAAQSALQEAMPELPKAERMAAAEIVQALRHRRAPIVERYAASVREQLRAASGGERGGRAPLRPAPALSLQPEPGLALALVDETEVLADVEVSRALEAVRNIAEHELREMAAYTSALSGDMAVTRDHNPFSPEVFARALWDAAQALPMSRAHQVMLVRHASTPLAQVLRKAYAGACARLEGMGVEPASHRTLVVHAPGRHYRGEDSWRGQAPDLRRMRDAMTAAQALSAALPAHAASPARPAAPDPLSAVPTAPKSLAQPLEHLLRDASRALRALPADAPVAAHAQVLASRQAQLAQHARSAVDQQLIAMLSRLFEYMVHDRRFGRDVGALVARMQPTALRMVLHEPAALEDYDHPVWQFVDEAVYQVSLYEPGNPAREQVLQLAERLIEQMSEAPALDVDHYRRATARLRADARLRFAGRLSRAGDDVARLQAMTAAEGEAAATGFGALDEARLDTVPASLIDNPPPPRSDNPDLQTWFGAQQPGDWIRLFCRGHWMIAQVLWLGRQGEVWLLGLPEPGRTLAMRRRALERLYAEGMLHTLRRRSLLRSAAVRMVRDGAQPAAA